MENKFLIDLSIKFGLDTGQVSKVTDMVYQCGITDMDSHEFQRVANYICQMKIMDKPGEEVMEELRAKGFIQE